LAALPGACPDFAAFCIELPKNDIFSLTLAPIFSIF